MLKEREKPVQLLPYNAEPLSISLLVFSVSPAPLQHSGPGEKQSQQPAFTIPVKIVVYTCTVQSGAVCAASHTGQRAQAREWPPLGAIQGGWKHFSQSRFP